MYKYMKCLDGEIGIHATLKMLSFNQGVGSSPTLSTNE